MDSVRKILLVSNGFYPEISPRSFRATELAKEFSRQGHHVVVITKWRDYDYSDFLKEYNITIKLWRKSPLPVNPARACNPFSLVNRIIARLLLYFFEYPGIMDMFKVKKVLKGERSYDLMISFAVPHPVHWGVAWAWSRTNTIAIKWIADCGDPYMFARLDTLGKPFYFKFLEKKFCRNCDYITVPFAEMSAQFYKEFLPKIKVIPQGFNFDEIKLYESQLTNNRPTFIYAGTVIPGKRDLTIFIDFISTLSIDFLFIIYTQKPEWFRRQRIILGKKLDIRGYIDRLSLIYEMSKADFLVNVDTPFDTESNIEAVPSKLIDYALSGRPILNLNSSRIDKDLVIEFMNGNYSRQRIIEKSRYDIKKITAQFLQL